MENMQTPHRKTLCIDNPTRAVGTRGDVDGHTHLQHSQCPRRESNPGPSSCKVPGYHCTTMLPLWKVNIVNIGTVATELQSYMVDNILATRATATLLAPDGVYFPFEDEGHHKLLREIGNVTEGLEITFQFAVKPECVEGFLQRDRLPFQLQLSFKTRDQQRVTRIITEQRPVTISSQVCAASLNMAVLGVHCAQLCARLTMEGRVQEAQMQLKAQQDLFKDIRKQRPIHKEESIYGNWMDSMTTICDDLTTDSADKALSDEAAKVVYQMKRASSVNSNTDRDAAQSQKPMKKKQALMEALM